MPLIQIGRACGNRDHTTVIHHARLKRNKTGCWDIKKESGLELWSDYSKLEAKLKSEAQQIMSDKKADYGKGRTPGHFCVLPQRAVIDKRFKQYPRTFMILAALGNYTSRQGVCW